MELKLLYLLVTACSAARISRNDVSPLSAQPSGGSPYLPVINSDEYPVTQSSQQETPQNLNQQQTNDYLPPLEAQQPNSQYTPVSDSVEVLNPEYFPINLGQNNNQYQTPENSHQQPFEQYQLQQDKIHGSQNINTYPNQYVPITDYSNHGNNMYSLPEDGGYYSKQFYRPYEQNINSEAYLTPSNIGENQYIPPTNNVEIASSQYILPTSNVDFKSNQYTPPTNNNAEIVSNQYIPTNNNVNINSNQYTPPTNNDAEVVSNQYIPPTNNVDFNSNQYTPPTNNNAEVPSNQYIPPENNVEVALNQYTPSQNDVEVISNQYSPSSNDVEIISNRNAAQSNYGQTQQKYLPQIETKDISNSDHQAQQNLHADFEPQKLVQNYPNPQNYNSKPASNVYLPGVTSNSVTNQYYQQNFNEYLPILDSALNQLNGQENSNQATNTKSQPNFYSPVINSPNSQYTQANNEQNYNVYPLSPNTKSVETEYIPIDTPVNQFTQTNNAPGYIPPSDTKSVTNQYLPAVDTNSQIKQNSNSPGETKLNSVEYLPAVVNTDNSKYAPLKNEYLSTVSEATRRYDSDFSKPSSVYNFNTISSTPYPYSYTFSTPATISRSRNDYYRSDESARTDRPVFKYSPKWPKIDSVTTPRSFETFKINQKAQSRQAYANSRSSAIGILSGSQQSDKFESSSADRSRFDSNHLDQNNHLRTPQSLDSIQNHFQSGNQEDNDHSSHQNSHYSGHTKESVPILKQMSEMAADGSFSYETLTGDQTHVMQQGHIENLGTDHEEQVIHGSYSYIGDDGKTYTVTYVADANGFRAVGDHIPTPPPVPEVIQKSIEFNLAEEIAKNSSTPGYQYGSQGDHNNKQSYSSPEQIRERSSYSKEIGYKY